MRHITSTRRGAERRSNLNPFPFQEGGSARDATLLGAEKVHSPSSSPLAVESVPKWMIDGTNRHGCTPTQPIVATGPLASGEIRTPKHLFLRQAAIPIRTHSLWCTREDLNLRVPLLGRSISDQAHAPVLGVDRYRILAIHAQVRKPRPPGWRTLPRPSGYGVYIP